MTSLAKRWDHGSSFEWLRQQPRSGAANNPWNGEAMSYGSGHDFTALTQRLALDAWYVDHRSMLLDLRMLLTLRLVVFNPKIAAYEHRVDETNDPGLFYSNTQHEIASQRLGANAP